MKTVEGDFAFSSGCCIILEGQDFKGDRKFYMEGIYFGEAILNIYFCVIFIYYFKKDDYKRPEQKEGKFEKSNKASGP